MCAHEQGQTVNHSKLASSLGVSATTVRSYLALLDKAFMLRLQPPLEANLKKRLVKSPKVYLRDSGLPHALLELPDHEALFGHPVRGASWEGVVIEEVSTAFSGWRASFFGTQAGAEIDLVLERGRRRLAIECKASSAPRPTRGFWTALNDLGIDEAYVVAPVDEAYPIADGVAVAPLSSLLAHRAAIESGARHPVIRD